MNPREWFMRLLGHGGGTADIPVPAWGGELYGIRPGAAITPRAASWPGDSEDASPRPYRMVADGIAEVRIGGVLSKRPDIFRWFGISNQATTPEMAAAVRAAASDDAVKGILLSIDSPGGAVFGTLEVAQAVASANAAKPVHAYGRDEVASCAYWIGSQARRLTTNAVAHAGAIGVYSILLDASQAVADAGLRFVVVKSGEFKGAGAVETPLTDEQVAYFQALIEDTNAQFLAAVQAGRGDRLRSPLATLADGRCHVGQKAAALGLTDAVGTYEEALAALIAEVGAADSPPRPEEAAPKLLPPDASDEPLPDDIPEEQAMSEKKETPSEPGAEELGLFRKMFAAAFGLNPNAQPKVEAPAVQPAGLTAEDVDKRIAAGIKAGLAEQTVTNDLAKYHGKVTPANLAAAKPVLLRAKTEGRDEDYTATLSLLGAMDESELLGDELASAEQTSEGSAHAVSGRAELLARNGIDGKREAELKRRYSIQ